MNQPNKKFPKAQILRSVLLVLMALVVGFGVYQWNASALAGNDLPMPFGVGLSVVVSGSMEPVLSVNDMIIVRPAKSYAVDDIVVFQTPTGLVVHRIVEIDGETVVTMGDANAPTKDEPIQMRDIKGRVVASIPLVGLLVDMIKSLPGTLAILALAAYLYWKSLKKERAADNEELDTIRAEIERLKTEAKTENEEQTENRTDSKE